MLFFKPNARQLVPDCFPFNNFNIFDFFKGKQSGTSRWCQGVAGAPKKYRRLQKATQSYEMITTRTKALPPKRHKRPFRSHTYVSKGAKNNIWAHGSTQSLLIRQYRRRYCWCRRRRRRRCRRLCTPFVVIVCVCGQGGAMKSGTEHAVGCWRRNQITK